MGGGDITTPHCASVRACAPQRAPRRVVRGWRRKTFSFLEEASRRPLRAPWVRASVLRGRGGGGRQRGLCLGSASSEGVAACPRKGGLAWELRPLCGCFRGRLSRLFRSLCPRVARRPPPTSVSRSARRMPVVGMRDRAILQGSLAALGANAQASVASHESRPRGCCKTQQGSSPGGTIAGVAGSPHRLIKAFAGVVPTSTRNTALKDRGRVVRSASCLDFGVGGDSGGRAPSSARSAIRNQLQR